MFFRIKSGMFLILAFLAIAIPARAQESGYQVIQGTRVYTEIDHANQSATFSNDCGRQTISRRDLQNGAIPNRIIPCPRESTDTTSPSPSPSPSPTKPGKRLWSAVAAGIDDGGLFGRKKVGVGLGKNYSTEKEAIARAISECEERVSGCELVTSWNAGCYYITTGNGGGVGWGAGRTAQRAYDKCSENVTNCDTQTLGNCHPE